MVDLLRIKLYIYISLSACISLWSACKVAWIYALAYFLFGFFGIVGWPSTNDHCARVAFDILPAASDITKFHWQMFCNFLKLKFQSFYACFRKIQLWCGWTVPAVCFFWSFLPTLISVSFGNLRMNCFFGFSLHSSLFRSLNFDWFAARFLWL